MSANKDFNMISYWLAAMLVDQFWKVLLIKLDFNMKMSL